MEITPKQEQIIKALNDPLYTVDFLKEWLNRGDNVFTNPVAALQAMGAKGFYSAVKAMEICQTPQKPESSETFVYADYEDGTGKHGNAIHYCCPKCSAGVGTDYRPIGSSQFNKDLYCRACGQAIDWSEE